MLVKTRLTMTARISIILNILLLLAIIHLYTLEFGKKDEAPSSGEKPQTSSATSRPSGNLRIAYVNGDSIQNNYQYIEDMYEEIGSEQLRAERQLQRQLREFEKEYRQLQEEATYMTQKELEKAQQRIMRKQEELRKKRDELSGKVRKKETRLQKKFFRNINDFLQDFNNTHQYDLILSYQKGGQVLLADDSLEITKEVLSGLNRSYREEQKAASNTP